METILIVDDDVETLQLTRIILERNEYRVLEATGGKDALQLVKKIRPDLILLDIMMPDMDGYEALKVLQADPRTLAIPVMMFSAKSGITEKVSSYDSGAIGFIEKPIDPRIFLAKVKTVLSRKITEARKKGYMLGVSSVKGGIGASTLTLNLAICLARKLGVEVTAVETRPGEGTWGMELKLDQDGIGNLLGMPPGDIGPETIHAETVGIGGNVRLLMSKLSIGKSSYLKSVRQMQALMEYLPYVSPLTLLDLGYSSVMASRIMNYCDELLLVVDPSPATIERAQVIVSELTSFGFSAGGSKPLFAIPVNRSQHVNALTIDRIERLLQIPVLSLIPPDPSLAIRAHEAKKPFVMVQPNNVVSMQYMEIAHGLAERLPKKQLTQTA